MYYKGVHSNSKRSSLDWHHAMFNLRYDRVIYLQVLDGFVLLSSHIFPHCGLERPVGRTNMQKSVLFSLKALFSLFVFLLLEPAKWSKFFRAPIYLSFVSLLHMRVCVCVCVYIAPVDSRCSAYRSHVRWFTTCDWTVCFPGCQTRAVEATNVTRLGVDDVFVSSAFANMFVF